MSSRRSYGAPDSNLATISRRGVAFVRERRSRVGRPNQGFADIFGTGLFRSQVAYEAKRSSTDLLPPCDKGADSGRVPARTSGLVPCGPLGSRRGLVRARRLASWTDLSTPIRHV